MIPKPAYKLKNPNKKENDPPRCSTEYNPTKKSAYFKNKLTKGCNNYESLKDAYSKPGDAHLKTDYNEYTFEPKLSSKRKDSNSRSFKKFMEDQENYQQTKQTKIRQFKTEMTKAQLNQCSSRPSIDKVSKRICTLMNYDQAEVVERLYKKKILEQFNDDEDLFSPKILPRSKSLKRSQNISQLLHSDAIRRKQKKQFQEAQKLHLSPPPTAMNNNTYQLVCNKMYNEFCQLISEDQTQLPIVMAWTVISQMFGVQLNPNKQGRQGKLCHDMASFLCKEGDETVERCKLWEFIEIIIKKRQARPKNFGDQIHKIIQQFGSLYTYRVARPKSQREGQQYSFFPQTLRSSDDKAKRYRDKLLDAAKQFLQNQNSKIKLNNQVTIQDIFIIDHMMKKASNQKKKITKEQEQMKECTFKPRLSESYRKAVYMPPRNDCSTSKVFKSKNTLFKSTSSHSISMNQSFMSQSLKPIQLKSNIRATLKKQKQNNVKNISNQEIKNMDKSIMRMAIARKDRELSNQIKNRGYPKNIQNWIQYAHQQKNQIESQHRKLKGFNYKKIALR